MRHTRVDAKRALLLCVLSACATTCFAQSYPAKVVRLIVPFTPGSGVDSAARIFAAGLGEVFGQQVIVDNRGGAAGNIGLEIAARAPADGYTLAIVSSGHTANASLYRSLPYDLMRDFAPVTQLVASPSLVLAHPSLPARSMNDLIRLAKARPGAINYSSAGAGTPAFVATELLKMLAGINLVHVPYRGGGEALTAVASGEVSVFMGPAAAALQLVRQGRLRALAVSSARRLVMLPEVPTVAESVAGYELQTWYGLVAPARTPREIISAVHTASTATLRKTDVSRRMADLAFIPVGNPPDEFAAYMKSEIEKLGKIIRELKLTAD